MAIAKPSVGSAGWNIAVDAVIDRVNAGGDIGAAPAYAGVPTPTRFRNQNRTDGSYAFDFPSRIRPPEATRRRLVVRNDGTTNVQLAYGSGDVTDYNDPGGSAYTVTIAPGKEYVEAGGERAVFVRPATTGNTVLVTVDVELGVI